MVRDQVCRNTPQICTTFEKYFEKRTWVWWTYRNPASLPGPSSWSSQTQRCLGFPRRSPRRETSWLWRGIRKTPAPRARKLSTRIIFIPHKCCILRVLHFEPIKIQASYIWVSEQGQETHPLSGRRRINIAWQRNLNQIHSTCRHVSCEKIGTPASENQDAHQSPLRLRYPAQSRSWRAARQYLSWENNTAQSRLCPK